LEATKDRKLNLDKFQTPDERIDYLEDLVVTLLERIGIDEEQLHELTEKRLYGNEDQEVKEGKTA
jgi:hypothetical protein